MAGRGMLFDEGPTACPFVALEADRDRRSAEPDPRHRCYAEPLPAPRALAHQREFCLSPGFGGCPIFQDWAIRAAARPVPLRPIADLSAFREDEEEEWSAEQLALAAPPGPAGRAGDDPSAGDDQSAGDEPSAADDPSADAGPSDSDEPATGSESGTGSESAIGSEPIPEFGLPPRRAASEVGRLPSLPLDDGPDEPEIAPTPPPERPARRRWEEDWPPAATPPAPPAVPAASAATRAAMDAQPDARPAADRPAERPRRVDYAQRSDAEPRDKPRAPSRREEWVAQRADLVPSWGRARYGAYPGIGRRIGIGDGGDLLRRLTRIFVLAALITLAVALLLLAPGFLAGFLAPDASPPAAGSPSPGVLEQTPTPLPTPTPVPSPQTYTIQPGDTLFGIAVQFGLTLEQILAANPTITDPNLIQPGQVIVIPPDDFGLPTPEPIPPPVASPAASP